MIPAADTLWAHALGCLAILHQRASLATRRAPARLFEGFLQACDLRADRVVGGGCLADRNLHRPIELNDTIVERETLLDKLLQTLG